MGSEVDLSRRCLLIGNSRWHWAETIRSQTTFVHTCPDSEKLLQATYETFHWSAVGSIPDRSCLDPTKEITLNDIPIANLPPWLGIDRALAAWGALKKAGEQISEYQGLLIADAGTVLSITKLEPSGQFGGGQLIPGLQLQLIAMANAGNNLRKYQNMGMRLDSKKFPFETSQAMHRGVFESLLGAVIQAKNDAKVPLWLCGGDSHVLFNELKERKINAKLYPDLVMEGMLDIQSLIT